MITWEISLLEFVSNAISYFIAAPLQEKFAIMGGVLMGVALIYNATQILRRKVQPAPVSWAIWASLDIIAASAMYHARTLNFQMAVAAIGAVPVFILSIPFGKPGWNPIDRWCLAGGAAALAWLLLGNPTFAIFFSIAAIGLGCLPTYTSIREDQNREDKIFWCVAFAASACALIGTKEISFDALAQPVVFILCQAWALWLLFRPLPVGRCT